MVERVPQGENLQQAIEVAQAQLPAEMLKLADNATHKDNLPADATEDTLTAAEARRDTIMKLADLGSATGALVMLDGVFGSHVLDYIAQTGTTSTAEFGN